MFDPVNVFGAIFIFVNAILGICFSSFIIWIYFTETQEKTSFQLICLSRAVNNVVVLVLDFLLLSFPVTLLSTHFYPISIETVIITSTVNVYMINQWQTILTAINRSIAIYLPFHYSRLCSFSVTALILAAMYLVRGYFTVSILYVLFSYNCPIFLSLETFGSTFEDPNCAMVLYTDDGSNDTVAYFLIFFAVTVGINLLTFAKILNFYFRQKLDAERLRSARKNIRSFFQTILQDSLFFVDVLFTFKLSQLSRQRIWSMVSAVFVWESIHTLDGLIMLMFSERIAIIKSRFKKKTKKIASHGPIYDIRSNSMPQIG